MLGVPKNDYQNLILQNDSVFELWQDAEGEKRVTFAGEHPLKYAAVIQSSRLNFFFEAGKEGSEAEIFLLCPVYTEKPLELSLDLAFTHDTSKAKIHIVSLVYTDAPTAVKARIHMYPRIQNAAADLLEEIVILSPKVQLEALPVLDIYAQNIQASHGAKMYRLDEDQLFYLCSKGLAFEQAQALLLSAYTEQLFEGFAL